MAAKTLLRAERMTLWATKYFLSQLMVTSPISALFLNSVISDMRAEDPSFFSFDTFLETECRGKNLKMKAKVALSGTTSLTSRNKSVDVLPPVELKVGGRLHFSITM